MNPDRIVIVLGGAMFAAVGVAFWLAPQQTAQLLGIGAIGRSGLVAIRADLGGLFVGLGSLCLVGAVSQRPAFLAATALMLGAIAVGRMLGMAVDGEASGQGGSLAIEIAAIVTLVVCARGLSGPPAARSVRDGAIRALVNEEPN